ncbi:MULTISPECIES: RES domain-containing protein [Bacteroidales]|uniref:RES family NAD+ phosphorylase n=1 Tax=Xylanibacter muris TaxID=2736290 RepID=A0ABX2APU4_9BACT|nr:MULTISPECIES: RES domain-containing protein [Bacteroidales]NPD93271.1 RES family NAD+ phosphorylase [Xylanibacter muris]
MVLNPENFLDMVRNAIFERSQVFQKDYSNDFEKVLSGCKLDYLTLLISHGIDSDSSEFESIKKVWDKIFNILTSSLSGRRSTAYTQLKNLLNGLFSEGLIYTHDKDIALYRMRICSLRKNIPRKEIFHIPFNLIRNIKTQRYSTPGYPCLYLAKSLYGSWEEMHRPPIESTLVSRFSPTGNFRVLDLRIPTVERFKKLEDLYLKYLPIIIACTIPVRNAEDVFKPEYIIPQFVLEWSIEKGPKHKLLGVIYTSSFFNREFFDLDYEWENIALPVQKMPSKTNYCPVLASLFKLTKPTCYEYEVMLGNLRLLSFNDEDNFQYLDGDKDKTAYYMSSFNLMEEVLMTKESDLIYRDM